MVLDGNAAPPRTERNRYPRPQRALRPRLVRSARRSVWTNVKTLPLVAIKRVFRVRRPHREPAASDTRDDLESRPIPSLQAGRGWRRAGELASPCLAPCRPYGDRLGPEPRPATLYDGKVGPRKPPCTTDPHGGLLIAIPPIAMALIPILAILAGYPCHFGRPACCHSPFWAGLYLPFWPGRAGGSSHGLVVVYRECRAINERHAFVGQ